MLRVPEISRALAQHDASTAYTLLRERLDPGDAGRALLELIRTVPDWPASQSGESVTYEQRLTPRELEVLRFAELGYGVERTAREIPLSFEAVKSHRRNLYVKLGVGNIAEAVHSAKELGLL